MRRLFSWPISALFLAVMVTGAHADDARPRDQSAPSPPDAPSDAGQEASHPEITVTGKAPVADPSLPKLAPDQFSDCYSAAKTAPGESLDIVAMTLCQLRLDRDKRVVIDKCINRDAKSTPPMAIQACTELLDRKILQGNERFYLFVNRAAAYFAQGDKQHALDDYNTAVKVAPRSAQPYYNRGVFYAAQADSGAAVKDFDTALSLDPKDIAALRRRAIVYVSQKNLSGALADFTEALRLQPRTASLWSERGYVSLLLRDFEGAVKDEAEAIRLDPKLARAYFLRGAAFGNLGNSPGAVSDLVTAVGLDPSLDRFVSTKGKTASIALPPL
jgi:tetratricopeptide (TPR) repeat protein